MASNKTSNQTNENQDDNQWPRFLIMEAANQNVPLDLNAFVLKKAIGGMANAELDNVKPMKSGRVFIEVGTKQQYKNLMKTTKLLGYLPVKVSPHRTLNSSKFVIKCEELDQMDEEEIKKEFQPQGIIVVKRISIRYSLYVLTIKGQNIPKKINIGYLKKKKPRPHIPNPQRCFQCQKFGHTKNSCKGKAICWMWWRRTQFRWLPNWTKMRELSRWPCCYIKRLPKMENWERHCDPQIYRKDFIRRCSQTFTTLFRPIKGFICNCNTDPSSIFKTSSTLGQKNPTSNWL